jgi:hypothetical protein
MKFGCWQGLDRASSLFIPQIQHARGLVCESRNKTELLVIWLARRIKRRLLFPALDPRPNRREVCPLVRRGRSLRSPQSVGGALTKERPIFTSQASAQSA